MTQPPPPPDPFGPMHANSVMLLETFRGHRRASGSLIESTCLVAAMYIAVHVVNDGQQEGQ